MESVRYLKPKSAREWAAYAAWLPLSAIAAWLLAARFGDPSPAASVRFTASASLGLMATVVAIAIPTGLNVVARVYEKYGSSRVRDVLLEAMPLTALALVSFAAMLPLLSVAVLGENVPSVLVWWALGAVATSVVLFFLFLDAVVDFVIREPGPAIRVMARNLSAAVESGDGSAYSEGVRGLGDVLSNASGAGAQESWASGCLSEIRLASLSALSSPLRQGLLDGGGQVSVLAEPASQVSRAFVAATGARNDEAARQAVGWFAEMLSEVAGMPGRTPDAAALLSHLGPMLESAFLDGRTAPQAYVSHGWYFAVAFPDGGGGLTEEYSSAYAEAAFSLVRRVVAQGMVEPFRGYYAYLSDWVAARGAGPDGLEVLDEMAFAVMAYALASGRPGLAEEMLSYGERESGRPVLPVGDAAVSAYLGGWCDSPRFRGFGGIGGDAGAKRLAAVLLAARGGSGKGIGVPAGGEAEAAEMAVAAGLLAAGGDPSVLPVASAMPSDATRRLRGLSDALSGAVAGIELSGRSRPGVAGLTGRFMRPL